MSPFANAWPKFATSASGRRRELPRGEQIDGLT